MTEHEAIGRVRRGAELLDREHPGWADRVPADGRLRMRLFRACVWGWTHGHYVSGLVLFHDAMVRATPPGEDFLIYHGICAPAESANQPHAYHLLADAWRAAIRARGGGLPRSMEGSPCSS